MKIPLPFPWKYRLITMALCANLGFSLSWAAIPGQTPLEAAISNRDLAAVKTFIAANTSSVNTIFSGTGVVQTPLMIAAQNNDVEMTRLLLDNGAKVNATGYNQFTPLHLATGAEVANLLIKAGADLTLKTNFGATPLQYAAMTKHNDVAAAILKAGAAPDLASELLLGQRDRALQLLKDHPEAAKGPPQNSTFSGTPTPLRVAAQQGDLEMVKLLVGLGADTNPPSRPMDNGTEGYASALYFATINSRADIVQFLLEHGANPNISLMGDSGQTSLVHLAIKKSAAPILQLLLEHGANPNAPGTPNQETPLMEAVEQGATPLVELLLNHHADTTIRNRKGLTIGDILAQKPNPDLTQVFAAHGVKLN